MAAAAAPSVALAAPSPSPTAGSATAKAPARTPRLQLQNASGLDQAQLAEAGPTGVVPPMPATSTPPVSSFAPRPRTGAPAAPPAATVYPGMFVPTGTPTTVIDSATYQGGNFPADIYQYMTAGDCQTAKPNSGVYTKNRYSSCAVWKFTGTLRECDTQGNCVTMGTASWRQTTVGQGTNNDRDTGGPNGSRVIDY